MACKVVIGIVNFYEIVNSTKKELKKIRTMVDVLETNEILLFSKILFSIFFSFLFLACLKLKPRRVNSDLLRINARHVSIDLSAGICTTSRL